MRFGSVKGTHLKELLLLLLFVIVKMVMSYITINPVYELHRDEYLYLDQANHLAAGYVSVPPLSSFIAFIIQLLGNTVFWVKFFPAFFGAITLVVCWYTVKELGGGIKARICTSLALIFSVLLRIDLLFQPNSFDVLSWTSIYYFLIRFIRSGARKWIIWTGIAIGLGFLNKYNVCFLLAGLLPALILTRQISLFFNKGYYLALLIPLVIILPNLFWQVHHHFPVVHHMKELMATQLVNVDRKDFLTGQLIFFLGSDVLIIAALAGLFFFPSFRVIRFVGWSYIFTIIIFVYFHAKNYYALGLYPVLIATGCTYVELKFYKGWKNYLLPAFAFINLAVFILVYPIIYPVLSPEKILQKQDKFKSLGLLKWEDGKDHPLPQDFADMIGWKELAQKALVVYKAIPDSEKNKTLVVCDNYGEAGAINYYNHGKMNAAVSMNADYINWFPDIEVKNIIAVKYPGNFIEDKYIRLFQSISQQGIIENQYSREYGAKVLLITGVDTSFRLLYRSAIEKEKF
ncbi:MAG TPA: glycosyltransferase family 39 protein [Flavisolibacter sp.]|nr:glycosyltransferase family 39 protein [Flavisolibacter sp.]